jgi:hypothetical protein
LYPKDYNKMASSSKATASAMAPYIGYYILGDFNEPFRKLKEGELEITNHSIKKDACFMYCRGVLSDEDIKELGNTIVKEYSYSNRYGSFYFYYYMPHGSNNMKMKVKIDCPIKKLGFAFK